VSHKKPEQDDPTQVKEKRFGILLKDAVDAALSKLHVPHVLYDYRKPYARAERVELAVLDREDGEVIGEFDWTLRRGVHGKIGAFIRAAILRASRETPRIYMEIEDRVGFNVKAMAERVAYAIRDIVCRLSDHMKRQEHGNVIGLVLVLDDSRRRRLIPMRLMQRIGMHARMAIEALVDLPIEVDQPEVIAEPVAIAEVRAAEPVAIAEQPATATPPAVQPRPRMPTRHRPPVLQNVLLPRIDRLFKGFVPHPAFALGVACRCSYPLRMPFRR